MRYLVVLNEGVDGKTPTPQTAVAWATAVKTMGAYPVTIDTTNQVYKQTFWDGSARPGKCALAPDMTILKCYLGANDTPGLDAIKAHAAAHPNGT